MPNRNRRNRKNTRKDRRKGRRASRRNMVGGGQGAGWTIGPAVAPEAPYAATNQPYDACLSAPRPGQIAYSDQGGLPGMGAPVMKGGGMNMPTMMKDAFMQKPPTPPQPMKGGAMSNVPPGPIMKEGFMERPVMPMMLSEITPQSGGACPSGCANPANGDLDKIPFQGVQSGGRYTFNLEAGDMQGFAQVDKIPCEPNWKNPLNPQSGGGSGGLANASDMGVYEAPTARYTQSPSQWTDSVGAPVLLNVPLDAKMWSRACTQTGGKRKGRKNMRKNRKTRRNRKANRK